MVAETSTAPDWMPGQPLTPFEESVSQALAAGAPAGVQEEVDPETMRSWGEDRSIRARVLRHLLTDETQEVDPTGLMLCGARVAGPVDLAWADVRVPVCFMSCYFDSEEPLFARHATVPMLAIIECDLPGLVADGLVAPRGVFLTDSTVHGSIKLLRAHIGGELTLTGATIDRGDDGNSLQADGIEVQGSLYLDRVVTQGAVRLIGSTVTGSLYGGAARILGVDGDGDALVADAAVIRGSIFLNDGFEARGTVRLTGSQIRGQVICAGASLGHGKVGDSIFADNATIDGTAFFNDGFRASGTVRLNSVTVHGSVMFDTATLGGDVAVIATGAHVDHVFRWGPSGPVAGTVILERMTVGRLEDYWTPDLDGWPPAGKLWLAGLTYEELGGADVAVDRRLAWIRRQYGGEAGFSLQPYAQLIRMYRASGQDTDARTVAIARAEDLRKYGDLTPWRRVGNWLLGITIRHGYKPGRALVFLVCLYTAVVATFFVAQHHPGTMVPAKQTSTTLPADAAEHCRDGYPCFYPPTYALDLLVPILDVPDADAWRPDGHRPWGGALVAWTVVATLLGWGATTLAALGFTGVVRKD